MATGRWSWAARGVKARRAAVHGLKASGWRQGARRAAALGCAAAAGLLPVLAPAHGAAAAPASVPVVTDSVIHGTWYHDLFGVPEIHEQGTRGQGVTVAVLDSPINPDVPDLDGAQLEPRTKHLCDNGYDGIATNEDAEHGTNMIELIVGRNAGSEEQPGVPGVAPDARVLHYAVLAPPEEAGCAVRVAPAVKDAVANGARVISMSFGWGDIDDLHEGVLIALRAGAVVNIAVQNEDGDRLDDTSAANGVLAIENVDHEGRSDGMEVVSDRLTLVAPGTNIRGTAYAGGSWDRYGLGTGTSPATAWTSGIIALAMSKWPQATGNQIIHSAIRNTSNGWQELDRTNQEGFGLLSPQNLMTVDPSIYPDVNPLVVDEVDAEPSWPEVMGDQERIDWQFTQSSAVRGSSSPVAHPTVQPVSWSVLNRGWFVPVLVTLAGLLAIAAIALPLTTRSKLAPAGAPGAPWQPGQAAHAGDPGIAGWGVPGPSVPGQPGYAQPGYAQPQQPQPGGFPPQRPAPSFAQSSASGQAWPAQAPSAWSQGNVSQGNTPQSTAPPRHAGGFEQAGTPTRPAPTFPGHTPQAPQPQPGGFSQPAPPAQPGWNQRPPAPGQPWDAPR